MHPISPNDARAMKFLQTEEDLALLQQHLKEIIEGTAFKGSHRSGQFLTYIVDQAAAGHFECLKERVIGVELFGRVPSYDTGDDAIVRVTASDVRRRLLQHYGKYGTTSKFRIHLPLGSYIPEISREPQQNPENGTREILTSGEPQRPPLNIGGDADKNAEPSESAAETAPLTEAPSQGKSGFHHAWLITILLVTTLNVALWAVWRRPASASPESIPPSPILPWSVLIHSQHAIYLITSDPDIAEIQQYADVPISISDYANHHVVPNAPTMTPEIRHFWEIILRDDKAAAVDTQIAVKIADLLQAYSKHIFVRAARSIQMSDLQTDDNFILMGSPRSNPWSALFSDQLDFQFVFDKNSGQEIIHNLHPRPHEATQYVPTALGGATGQSYAILALVRNPDQNGQVLLLAGANAEGTEAAGKLITDLPRLSIALQGCGISPIGPLQHFELLLKLNTMAGSPSNAYVEACHILPGTINH